MADYREAFIGIDVAKLRNAIAIADAGRDGEVRFLVRSMRRTRACAMWFSGSLRSSIERTSATRQGRRDTGFIGSSARLVTSAVVAPSLIPRKPGDRVKANRRDAVSLARLLRAGELTAVWVPDEGHEAMRDLVRARAAAVETLRVHRQQVSAFMLKHGRVYPRKKGWTMRYLCWLQEQKFDQARCGIEVAVRRRPSFRSPSRRRARCSRPISAARTKWATRDRIRSSWTSTD